jgi:RHS repeat-associated protein
LPTTFKFTGQRQESSLGGAEGLYYYGARWYDPSLGRFAQADSIIPEASQGAQAWDRYAYVNNSPVKYVDPSGHCIPCIVIGIIILAVGTSSCNSSPTNQPTDSLSPLDAIQKNIDAGTPESYKMAIDLAVEYYQLDTSHTITGNSEGIFVDSGLNRASNGYTYPNRAIGISYNAFPQTPGELGSTLNHELLHATQIAEGRSYTNEQGNCIDQQGCIMNEVEAWTLELNNAAYFGLSEEEIDFIRKKWLEDYNKLTPENQARADQGIYTVEDGKPTDPR